MPDRCLVHRCSNRSVMNVGISAHFSPTIKSERDTWLRFVHTHRANLNPSGTKFVAGVFSPFRGECFSRASHMEGCRRRLIPGSITTILKIEPGKQSSKRQHRKVSLVQFYLSFSIVSAMKFSFSQKYPICLFPDISAICKYIFKSLIKFSIVHIAALLYFSFLSHLFIPVMWHARKILVYRRAFQWFPKFSNQP